MAENRLGNDRYFAGFLLLLAAFLVTLGITIFPHRDTVSAPTAATGGSREVAAPGNPPRPVGADSQAPQPQSK